MTVEVGSVPVTDSTPSSVPTEAPPVSLSEDTAAARTLNRTTRPTDLSDDPLDITPKTVPPTGEEAKVEEETKVEEVEEEEKPEEEKQDEEEAAKKAKEEFTTNLDNILTEKSGVGLDGVVEAITTLLSWYNDILAIEAGQSAPPQSAPSSPPQFQRSQGRAPLPAQTSYDYRKSEILAMDAGTYSKNAQSITNAYLKGRVLNDVD